jgi:hypothetical protein
LALADVLSSSCQVGSENAAILVALTCRTSQ